MWWFSPVGGGSLRCHVIFLLQSSASEERLSDGGGGWSHVGILMLPASSGPWKQVAATRDKIMCQLIYISAFDIFINFIIFLF